MNSNIKRKPFAEKKSLYYLFKKIAKNVLDIPLTNVVIIPKVSESPEAKPQSSNIPSNTFT